jgi:hypothetical protein
MGNKEHFRGLSHIVEAWNRVPVDARLGMRAAGYSELVDALNKADAYLRWINGGNLPTTCEIRCELNQEQYDGMPVFMIEARSSLAIATMMFHKHQMEARGREDLDRFQELMDKMYLWRDQNPDQLI